MAGRDPGRIDGDDATAADPLLQQSDSASTLGPASSAASSIRSLSPGGREHRRRRKQRAVAVTRRISFAASVLLSLCAGSITVFSLYGHIFQRRLHYSQFQVNGVAIAGSLSSYLPVPLLGYVCDRAGPAPLSFIAALVFGGGYGLAAGVYKSALAAAAAAPTASRAGSDESAWTYPLMLLAFVGIGVGTCSMYLSAVATCAKNFGKGKHRGLALAVPIASFGLSGMWQSQLGSRLLYERMPDGSKGDVDVFAFFIFLAILLFVVGVIGTFTMRVVDERDLIDDAVEELERSGILDSSAIFHPTPGRPTPPRTGGRYGTIEPPNLFEDEGATAAALDPAKDDHLDDADAKLRKTWLLNAETRRFLTDRTMWMFAFGFFFVIGPGEAFINNLGTVIPTLYPPTVTLTGPPTSPATHVSIVGITSTVVRLLTGSLTDLLAPSPQAQHVQISSSVGSLPPRPRISVSRVTFLLFFAVLLSLGLVALASGMIQNHGERFWIVSGLVGAGYGAVFSLTPIIITVIWGVENFGTNWGIVAMMPALGATVWGLVYSAVYQAGAQDSPSAGNPAGADDGDDIFCYGTQCYAPTFWAEAVSVWIACCLVLLAWKGRNGWAQRGIVI